MGRARLYLVAIPALRVLEVTLSLSFSLCLPSSLSPLPVPALLISSLASVPHTLVLEAGSCKWGSLCPVCLPRLSLCVCLPLYSLSYLLPAVSKGGVTPSPVGQREPLCEPRGKSLLFTQKEDPSHYLVT